MKVNLFKLEKNKRFSYNPRYYKEKAIQNIYAFDSAFIKNRNFTSSVDISSQWKVARLSYRNRSNRNFSTTIIVIALDLVLIFLFVSDFDLSIFSK